MTWQTRIALARLGWHTEIRFTKSGIGKAPETTYACGVWARRKYWNGWVADICFHNHDRFDTKQPGASGKVSALVENVADACHRAAIDFPGKIPCQAGIPNKGNPIPVTVNDWEMKNVDLHRPPLHPTEAIPASLASCEPGFDHIAHLLSATRDGFEVEDSITPYFGRPRYANDCQDRDWGYRLRIAKRRTADGSRISYQPQTFTSESLQEPLVAALIKEAHRGMSDLFSLYAPGGSRSAATPNGLPPGFTTVAEIRASKKAEQSAEDE